MTGFGSPLWFFALVAILFRLVLMFVDQRRAVGVFRYSSLALIQSGDSLRVRTRWLPIALEVLGTVLLIIALARPQQVISVEDERLGIDIAVVLDSSGSMAAEDFRPLNRFSVAKKLIDQFIARRSNDRIGLITFGSRAATRVPITFDRAIARDSLDAARVGENGDGTAIGHAIATAVNRLRPSAARSKVMILLTDGVNNAGSIDPPTAAKLAADFEIKIYAVGVGSRGPVPVPVRSQNRITGEIETVYQLIRADLDDEMLGSIAQSTGGAYFRATDETALEEVLIKIDELEKTPLGAPRAHTVNELYPVPLASGLSLLFVSVLLGETVWMRLPS